MADIPVITTQLQSTASAADIFSSKVLTSQFASTSAPTSMMSSSISRITDTMSPRNSSLLLNSLSSVDQSNQLYHHNFLVQDQRTLQLAVELSLAGLNDATAVTATSSVQTPVSNADIHNRAAHAINYQHQLLHRHVMNQEDLCSLKAMSSAVSTATNGNIEHIGSCGNGAVTSTNILSSNGSNNITLNNFFTANSMLTSAIDDRSKKSQNMTECVPVPSSEHVAEIVGRQDLIMEVGKCRLCCRPHSLRHCHAFLAMTPVERYESARVHRYCVNCLATSHTTGACTSTGSCRHCGRAHHTLLHRRNVSTAIRNRRPTPPPPVRHRRDERRGRTRQRAIERPAARLQSCRGNQRNLRHLVNQAKSTLDQLQELLQSSTSQARRHVEDMHEDNLIEFD